MEVKKWRGSRRLWMEFETLRAAKGPAAIAHEEGRLLLVGMRLSLSAGDRGSLRMIVGAKPVTVVGLSLKSSAEGRVRFGTSVPQSGDALAPFHMNELIDYTPDVQFFSGVNLDETGMNILPLESRVTPDAPFDVENTAITRLPGSSWSMFYQAPSGLSGGADISLSATVIEEA